MSPDEFIDALWSYAQEVPMAQHPWFQGILQHRWTPTQIILGEVQHYLRVRTNPIFFGYIAVNAVTEKQPPPGAGVGSGPRPPRRVAADLLGTVEQRASPGPYRRIPRLGQ